MANAAYVAVGRHSTVFKCGVTKTATIRNTILARRSSEQQADANRFETDARQAPAPKLPWRKDNTGCDQWKSGHPDRDTGNVNEHQVQSRNPQRFQDQRYAGDLPRLYRHPQNPVTASALGQIHVPFGGIVKQHDARQRRRQHRAEQRDDCDLRARSSWPAGPATKAVAAPITTAATISSSSRRLRTIASRVSASSSGIGGHPASAGVSSETTVDFPTRAPNQRPNVMSRRSMIEKPLDSDALSKILDSTTADHSWPAGRQPNAPATTGAATLPGFHAAQDLAVSRLQLFRLQ